MFADEKVIVHLFNLQYILPLPHTDSTPVRFHQQVCVGTDCEIVLAHFQLSIKKVIARFFLSSLLSENFLMGTSLYCSH